jgi:general secretion pathway protein K
MVRDRGYALVAAVTAVAAFAYIAFQVLAADRGETVGVGARVEHAKLEAAADAGMMMAIHVLGDADPAQRWSIDGRLNRIDFDGMTLDVAVEDERGKVPLDGLNPSQSRVLFLRGGASDERADALVDELRTFQSGDDERQADATDDSSGPLVPPTFLAQIRQGGFRTVGDLMALKDMDAALYRRIASAATVFFEESGPFEPRNAGALAKATMAQDEDDDDSPDVAGPQAADDDQPARPTMPVDVNLIGRTLTVRVFARDRRGAQTHRMAIVELTGAEPQSYWIRYVE